MYSRKDGDGRCEVRMSADVTHIDRFCGDLSAFLARAGLSALEFDFGLMAREALANAILHGSGGDPDKEVFAVLALESARLSLTVRDQGPGWNWGEHDWSTPPPGSVGGRGLCILRHYSDEVLFNGPGNEVIIIKRLEAQEAGMETTKQVVVMGQSLSAATLDQYRTEFKGYITSGVRELVLDCSALEVVDSMGIGLLVATHNSLVKQGGELVMTRTSEPIYNLMSTMRLNRHFTVNRD